MSDAEILKRSELYRQSSDWIYFGKDQKVVADDAINIVIIDDSPDQLHRTRRIASLVSYCVVTFPFNTARAAIDWLDENDPDLVITDYKLNAPTLYDPYRDTGIHIIDVFEKTGKDIPCIIITSYAEGFLSQYVESREKVELLDKSYLGNELFDVARNLLGIQ